MKKELFIAKMTPFAIVSSAMTNIPVNVILSQWGHESAWGESDLAKRGNNFAGIKYTDRADFKTGAYSGYNSVMQFAIDYAKVMQSGYYDKIRGAKGTEETIKAFIGSAYAEDNSYAKKLGNIVSSTPETKIVPYLFIGGLLLTLTLLFKD